VNDAVTMLFLYSIGNSLIIFLLLTFPSSSPISVLFLVLQRLQEESKALEDVVSSSPFLSVTEEQCLPTYKVPKLFLKGIFLIHLYKLKRH